MKDQETIWYKGVRALLNFILFVFFRDIELVNKEENVPEGEDMRFVATITNINLRWASDFCRKPSKSVHSKLCRNSYLTILVGSMYVDNEHRSSNFLSDC